MNVVDVSQCHVFSARVECQHDDEPVHRLTSTKGFWVWQIEVIQAALERVVCTSLQAS